MVALRSDYAGVLDPLIEEARQRQRRRRRAWAALAMVASLAAGIFFAAGGGSGSGSGGRPVGAASISPGKVGVIEVTHPPRPLIGAMNVTVATERRFGQAIRPTITDQGVLVNRGNRPVYIDGRPMTLSLQPLLPGRRLGKPRFFILKAPPRFHLAGVYVSGSRSVFVVATTKRPPASSRNVVGRRIAVWYSLDG
jgi:hypothetical protein